MGMFDWYEPKPPILSPKTQQPLTQWQGKDGPRWLFLWIQGEASPVDQLDVSDDCKVSPESRAKERLPDEFYIYCYEGDHRWDAKCKCEDGVWKTTQLVKFDRISGRAIPV